MSKKQSSLKRTDKIHTTTLRVLGIAQGVGFRPFLYRLAHELNIGGWTQNDPQGVTIELVASPDKCNEFIQRMKNEAPPAASLKSIEIISSKLGGIFTPFTIHDSEHQGSKSAMLPPDLAICSDCYREMLDANNRRYLYPFINCVNCGPRWSIITRLPYDRPHTTMACFSMCDDCRYEYKNPLDRRFHAQPIACPKCGPRCEFVTDNFSAQKLIDKEAITEASKALLSGKIIALKGLGGFQLLCSAKDTKAIALLRERKRRDEKPFAVLFPNLASIDRHCRTIAAERDLLTSSIAPIVLLERKNNNGLSELVAPKNPYIGAMLPYTPLHCLLMMECCIPVVATSGNISDEPICISNEEAFEKLGGIADAFLLHNRPIAQYVDDSVVKFINNEPVVLRRARGYAPVPIHLEYDIPSALAVGAHLKNTVSVAVGSEVFMSQHIGDLETPESRRAFHDIMNNLSGLYDVKPKVIACDLHPNYYSTSVAEASGIQPVKVQHHYAHILSCLAENRAKPPVLGVSWDGTGYGLDGSIWGGEFLIIQDVGFIRAAHLKPFRLPGGDTAVKEPRRTALGLLYEIYGEEVFEHDFAPTADFKQNERELLKTILLKGINSPKTTSAGRLFDAVASIINLRHRVKFEGQAAMELEFAYSAISDEAPYPIKLIGSNPIILDWTPMISAIINDVSNKAPLSVISHRFHHGLANAIQETALAINMPRIALSGGCFQNKHLTELTISRLQSSGFIIFTHKTIPPNDNGVSLGQLSALKEVNNVSGNTRQSD